MTRRKLSPRPEPRGTSSQPLAAAPAGSRSSYAGVLARARALGLFAVTTIAPLGALAGSVSACGAAAPVQAQPYPQPTQYAQPYDPNAPPPVTPIAPPGAAPSEAPSPAQQVQPSHGAPAQTESE